MYTIRLTEEAQKDVVRLQRNCPSAIKKLNQLIDELKDHPRTGTGQVEQLVRIKNISWYKHISQEDARSCVSTPQG